MSTTAVSDSRPDYNIRRLSESNKKAATIISFLLIPLSGLITDIYIPSMPQMATSLHQSQASIQLTLTLFLVSYGLTQFISGSMQDSYGRYRLTLWSLGIFVLSCLAIALTKNITLIYLMRIVQGVVTGFIVVGKRAFFVDVYEGEKRKHYLSMMSIVWSAAPVMAPFVGGYLQQYFSWQANFYTLAGYGFLMLILEWIYGGETVPQYRHFKWRQISRDYKTMLHARMFALGLITAGLCYGSTMIFNLSAPFIIEHQLHYSPVITGYAALCMGLAWMAGGFIGKALIRKDFVYKLRFANILQLMFAALMIASGLLSHLNLYMLLLFAFLIHLTVGFIFNNYFAYCLGYFPQQAGVASGLAGGSNFIITSVCSYTIVGLLQPQSQQALGLSYLIMALIALCILQFGIRRSKL